jgi:hypothetical protein
MTGQEIPIRIQTARRLGVRASRRQGTLLLYPDKLVHVHSPAIRWGTTVGLLVVLIASFALTGSGPGALGALIGAGGGSMVGAAIARRQAAGKVTAGGDDITVIPLDSITSLQARKSAGIGGWLGGQRLIVTTADGTEHTFAAKLDKWAADLSSALTGQGSMVRPTPQGMAVTPAATA